MAFCRRDRAGLAFFPRIRGDFIRCNGVYQSLTGYRGGSWLCEASPCTRLPRLSLFHLMGASDFVDPFTYRSHVGRHEKVALLELGPGGALSAAGEVAADKAVVAVEFDESGSLWLASADSVSVYHSVDGSFKNAAASEGQPPC